MCVRPGTEIAFEKEVECVNNIGVLPKLKGRRDGGSDSAGQQDKPNVHHDVLEFPSGKIVLLRKLCKG